MANTVGKRVFISHLVSASKTSRGVFNTDSVPASSTDKAIKLQVSGSAFGGAIAGDVVRILSAPGADASAGGQSAIVQSVATGTLTLTTATKLRVPQTVSGWQFRVEAPRTTEDVSGDVLRLTIRDYIDEFAQQLVVELANTSDQYSSLFEKGDPIEAWIDDGDDAATPAVTFPSSVTDTTRDANRAFVGRIDKVERVLAEDGQRARITCRDYTADLMEHLVRSIFLSKYLVNAITSGANESVAHLLYTDLNTRRGYLADTSAGQPSFAWGTPDVASFTPVQASVAFVGQTFFDAFARLAESTLDLSSQPLVMWVDSLTYQPRVAGTKPTLNIKTRAAAGGASISWSIEQGVNIIDANPTREGDRVRNSILYSTDDRLGVPVLAQREQRYGLGDTLGSDRLGQLEGLSTAKGAFDGNAAVAAAQAALSRVSTAAERRSLTRVGVLEPTRRLSGAQVATLAPVAGITVPTYLGIVGATHDLTERGFTTDFDLTLPRAGWNRIMAPLSKSVQATIKEDAYAQFFIAVAEISGSDVIIRFVAPQDWAVGPNANDTLTPPAWTFPGYAAGFIDFAIRNGRLVIAQDNGAGNGTLTLHVWDIVTRTSLVDASVQPFVGFASDAMYWLEEGDPLAAYSRIFFKSGQAFKELYFPNGVAAGNPPNYGVGRGAPDGSILLNLSFAVLQDSQANTGHRMIYVLGIDASTNIFFITLDYDSTGSGGEDIGRITRPEFVAPSSVRDLRDGQRFFLLDPRPAGVGGTGALQIVRKWNAANDLGGNPSPDGSIVNLGTYWRSATTPPVAFDLLPLVKFYA